MVTCLLLDMPSEYVHVGIITYIGFALERRALPIECVLRIGVLS